MANLSKKFSDEDLIKMVEQCARKHEKVTIKLLTDETGISSSTWYKRPEVKKVIDMINNASVRTQLDIDNLPSVNEIYKKYGSSEEKMKVVLGQLLDAASKKAKDNHYLQELTQENEKLKREIREKDTLIRVLNDKVNVLIANNDSMINLSDNIDKMNRKTFGSQFGEMFGEND